jgi:hypothetical protein
MATACRALLLALVTSTQFAGGAEAAGGWNHKAVVDERSASRLVGGFSTPNAQDYRAGLAYLRKRRVNIGSYTIADAHCSSAAERRSTCLSAKSSASIPMPTD